MDRLESQDYLKLLIKNADLAIQQNSQILTQLRAIEDKVDHTNGTVRDHADALEIISRRHAKEDREREEEKRLADEISRDEKQRSDRLITAVWSVAGVFGTGVVLLAVNWISHLMGWVH